VPADLHIALQRWYASDDGLVETPVDGYRADVLRDGVIYEIQTKSFTAIRDKLRKLAKKHAVVLVHPIAQTKFIAKLDPDTGEQLSVRRSPKRGRPAGVFNELLYLRKVMQAENVTLEIVMTVERELRCDDGEGSWRRGGVSIVGHELLAIVGRHRFAEPADLLALLPEDLPERFTTGDLRHLLGLPPRVAGKMAWGLHKLGVIRRSGKLGRFLAYRLKKPK